MKPLKKSIKINQTENKKQRRAKLVDKILMRLLMLIMFEGKSAHSISRGGVGIQPREPTTEKPSSYVPGIGNNRKNDKPPR